MRHGAVWHEARVRRLRPPEAPGDRPGAPRLGALGRRRRDPRRRGVRRASRIIDWGELSVRDLRALPPPALRRQEREIRHGHWARDRVVRLFNRTRHAFDDAVVHESVPPTGPVLDDTGLHAPLQPRRPGLGVPAGLPAAEGRQVPTQRASSARPAHDVPARRMGLHLLVRLPPRLPGWASRTGARPGRCPQRRARVDAGRRTGRRPRRRCRGAHHAHAEPVAGGGSRRGDRLSA
jgi:hypothetical protein